MLSPRKKTCFILLPGFSSDNVSVLALKHILERQGYSAIATSFFGDIAVDDFQKLSIGDCQKNISNMIDHATLEYDRVIGVGVSLGGAQLLEHAKTKDNMYGIVSVGTPFKLKYRWLISVGEFLVPILYPIWKHLQKIKRLRLLPIGAGPAIVHYLENEFLQELENIKTPILFLHSKKDMVTDYRVLPEFAEKISSGRKEIVLSKNGDHAINYDPEYIFTQLEHFFDLH